MNTVSRGAPTDYTTTKPGRSLLDEARRATSDLCQRTEIWVRLAKDILAAASDSSLMLDPSCGPDDEPRHIRQSVVTMAGLRQEVRDRFGEWDNAISRAVQAIMDIQWTPLGIEHQPILHAITTLRVVFERPLVLVHDERPGDHLLRAGGPLFARKRDGSNLERHLPALKEAMETLARFSNMLGVLDESGVVAEPSSVKRFAVTQAADSRLSLWTVRKLSKRIGRGSTKIGEWRKAAEPKVPPRKKGQGFRDDELTLIADAARFAGDADAARAILATIGTLPE